MNTLETIYSRRSIRRFTDEAISDEHLHEMLDAAMTAPSAGNAQPWEFIVVRSQEGRDGIARHNAYAAMALKAPMCIVVCGNTAQEKHPGFWPQDCAAAIQNLMLAARHLGIGTVWTGVHPVEDRVAAFKELFNLPEHVIPLGIVVLGHPDQPFTEHHRFDATKIHQEKW